eukprot:417805-Rhodomonas_salina.3
MGEGREEEAERRARAAEAREAEGGAQVGEAVGRMSRQCAQLQTVACPPTPHHPSASIIVPRHV